MKIKLPQLRESTLYIVFIGISLLAFDGILILKYIFTHHYFQEFNYGLYAYSYQKCGYVSRGLVPTVFEWLHLKNPVYFLALFNVLIMLYSSLLVRLSKTMDQESRFLFLLSASVLFFGPLHFAVDVFKFDLMIQVAALAGFLFLKEQKLILFILIYVIALLIHDASYFLFLPLALLMIPEMKKKLSVAAILSALFVITIIFAKPLPAEMCAKLVGDYTGIKDIPFVWYAQKSLPISKNLPYFFGVINVPLLAIGLIIYLIGNYLSFPALWKGKFSIEKYFFIFPVALCVISIDWYRWICFFFFVTLLYALYLNVFNRRSFFVLTGLTVFMGIPVFITLKFSLFMKILTKTLHALL